MPRGGARPGAGRKKGAATKKTRAVAVQAAAEGITPLEVMLEAMRQHHAAGNLSEAVEVAKLAAPYCHPRLSTVTQQGPGGGPIPITFVEVAAPHASPDRDGEQGE